MSLDLKGIITQLASMDCKVGQLMDGQRRNIGAAAWQESMLASLPALAPSSPLPVPAMSEQEMGSVILKRNLKSRDSSIIAENKARRRWNVNECIDHPENVALINYLCQYVLAQPCAGNFWSSMVVSKIQNNYKQHHRSYHSTMQQDILARCTHTYLTNWRLIDNEMGLEAGLLSEMLFLHLLQKDVMSDGESDMEDMNIATIHVLQIKRPSWRSDELNNFLEIVDFVAVHTCSDKSMLKSRARMPRLQSEEKNVVVPCHLISLLPHRQLNNIFFASQTHAIFVLD
ncbi:hypothetical protein PHYBLDRAFT_174806 [Phycomyces blakesleeanus NRRL 1555(-)]|uniref:Uncharacterized protein n=1 Tax=Phycomyces blakesleeanus (strain ATCC 8743b / DSM 1359 / FGSC 10004 / NBRC 33097 / NRRL 1555) TaxID=763407 RepID=A0A162ZHH9_PHYB8|nr:hypothetical protein PHYBLDRAFT_174806 [Phycomyces blakesleeanus NRRL 1555(-)]OAD66781.1 hypothetical protein PHYBLDRAFT_174806 [Phycomyces blakesleeanus NRRL 1555(-)]|eukprot:XP_018284821.1 hypothetical protein PHYBLDRAFT_174806 [Phycomyces blakesleeanus NRRL 1555(-)]